MPAVLALVALIAIVLIVAFFGWAFIWIPLGLAFGFVGENN